LLNQDHALKKELQPIDITQCRKQSRFSAPAKRVDAEQGGMEGAVHLDGVVELMAGSSASLSASARSGRRSSSPQQPAAEGLPRDVLQQKKPETRRDRSKNTL